jgi:hypothetical protein
MSYPAEWLEADALIHIRGNTPAGTAEAWISGYLVLLDSDPSPALDPRGIELGGQSVALRVAPGAIVWHVNADRVWRFEQGAWRHIGRRADLAAVTRAGFAPARVPEVAAAGAGFGLGLVAAGILWAALSG